MTPSKSLIDALNNRRRQLLQKLNNTKDESRIINIARELKEISKILGDTNE